MSKPKSPTVLEKAGLDLKKYKDPNFLKSIFGSTDVLLALAKSFVLPILICVGLQIVITLLISDKEYNFFGFSLGLLLAFFVGLGIGLILFIQNLRKQALSTFEGTLEITNIVMDDIKAVQERTEESNQLSVPELGLLFHQVFKFITLPYLSKIIAGYLPIPFAGKISAFFFRKFMLIAEKPFLKKLRSMEKDIDLPAGVKLDAWIDAWKGILLNLKNSLSSVVGFSLNALTVPAGVITSVLLLLSLILFTVFALVLI